MRLAGLVMIVALVGCGADVDPKDVAAAREALAPSKARLEAIQAALPAPGSEREIPIEEPLGRDGLETIDARLLAYSLGADDDGDTTFDMNLLTTDPMQGLRDKLSPAKGKHVGRGGLMNLQHAARALAEVRHVVVFRATTIVPGKIDPTPAADGAYQIVDNARWTGWAFAYSFADPPVLLAAIPLDLTNRDSMSVMVEQGRRPGDWQLLEDALTGVRDDVIGRLAGR